MIEYLDTIDKELVIYLNQMHGGFWDLIMVWFTEKETWYPFYVVIIGLLAWNFRYKTLLILLFIALLITLTDRFSSGVVKPATERFRPCHNPEIAPQLRLIDGCGGKYGFFSSHAANTFAIAMFLWLILRARNRWIAVMFLWAFLVSYSRIYLGKHYPGDIITGAVCGILFAWIIYLFYNKTDAYIEHRKLITRSSNGS